MNILPTKAPSIGLPTVQYDPRQQQAINNQLRFYFSQIDNDIYEIIQEIGSINVRSWLGLGDGC